MLKDSWKNRRRQKEMAAHFDIVNVWSSLADIRAELLITVTDAGIKKSLAVLLTLEWNKMRPLLIDRDNRKSPIVSLKPWNWLMCGSLEIDLPMKQLDH